MVGHALEICKIGLDSTKRQLDFSSMSDRCWFDDGVYFDCHVPLAAFQSGAVLMLPESTQGLEEIDKWSKSVVRAKFQIGTFGILLWRFSM